MRNGPPPAPGMQLGPPGRWWDDKSFSKSINLQPQQRQQMDDVFNANKTTLFNTYRTLKTEEAKLDTLQHAKDPDENAILSQIDRVTQLRGDLAKANTSMVLQLRKQLTDDQVQKLESMK